MNIEQLTNMAFEIVNELEPQFSFDVFDVSESQIIFQDEHGLKRICVACLDSTSLKQQIKANLQSSHGPNGR